MVSGPLCHRSESMVCATYQSTPVVTASSFEELLRRAMRLLVNAGMVLGIRLTVLAQDVTKPSPGPPSSKIAGPQLLAWSAAQKPQPLDQPGAESDRRQRPSPQRDQPVSPS